MCYGGLKEIRTYLLSVMLLYDKYMFTPRLKVILVTSFLSTIITWSFSTLFGVIYFTNITRILFGYLALFSYVLWPLCSVYFFRRFSSYFHVSIRKKQDYVLAFIGIFVCSIIFTLPIIKIFRIFVQTLVPYLYH